MLGDILPPGSVVVTNEVGAVAYVSRLPVIDMIGLTDAVISRILFRSYQMYGRGGSRWSVTEVSGYLLSREPDCLMLPAYQPLAHGLNPQNRRRMHPLWYQIYHDLETSQRYRCLGQFKINDSKFLYLYVKKDLELAHPWPAPGPAGRCLEVLAESDK